MGIGALIVLASVAAGTAGVWAAKLLADRARRLEAIAEHDHEITVAELVVMAMLADGELTAAEWGVVRRAFGEHGYSLLEADGVIGGLREEAERVRARGELGRWVATKAAPLATADRELVYAMVVELSLKGAEYRAADGPHGTLLATYGVGLGLSGARQRELNLEVFQRSGPG